MSGRPATRIEPPAHLRVADKPAPEGDDGWRTTAEAATQRLQEAMLALRAAEWSQQNMAAALEATRSENDRLKHELAAERRIRGEMIQALRGTP